MPRVKRGTTSNKTRKNILKYTKGFRWGRKSKERLANEALLHAFSHMFKGRKEKKRNFRTLWNNKIGAAVKPLGMNYSRFIDSLKKNNITLDRKILADLAENQPEVFTKIVEQTKNTS
ncbi:MAG: 50S ribosomal protein L20 [Candidatus Harrisonbacteria bacterium CG10_big_fil_rev_8_21_14_0_10_38_8]|uniref:Large ribosomal subunit protein bL20 n=1 Tax=Candidatus Harrisonbacteria bacterium CG10_big_fil_rev_8_21_14_0_10_38_8 TaxID=1974582 RepID=A0A2M6WJH0_9BACT|nr:MAG: 50S ribosomal protein L20 [Candidatus Harrisonbacteria bacterium CG10_big_fil_rev_8_21_14_0_10_38_8]